MKNILYSKIPGLILFLSFAFILSYCIQHIGDDDDATVDNDGDGYSEELGDCDDTDATVYPGATEVPYDGVDQNCDGEDLTDVDWDNFDAEEAGGDDCDDNDSTIYPGADEVPYDGIDQDCDGKDLLDVDGDGHDAEEAGGDDCDDNDSTIYPGADEIPYDDIDQDCDGEDLLDADGDGHDADFVGGDDCDDENPTVYPGAEEDREDGIDNDCDGEIDEETPVIGAVEFFYHPADASYEQDFCYFIALFADTIGECNDPFNELVYVGIPWPEFPSPGTIQYVEYGSIDFWDYGSATFYSVGDDISVQGPTSSFIARREISYPIIYYSSGELYVSDFEYGSLYNISADGDDLSAFSADVLYLPEEFEVISPDVTEYNMPVIKYEDLEIVWTPSPSSYGDSYVVVSLLSDDTRDIIYGVEYDSAGSMTIPSTYIENFPNGTAYLLIGKKMRNTMHLLEGDVDVWGKIEYWVWAQIRGYFELTPSSGAKGETLDVVVDALSANFVDGVTTADFGSGITVNSVSVSDSTTATVNITIEMSATTGTNDVTLTTGSEVLYEPDAFTILPALTCTPDSGEQGETLDVVVRSPSGGFTSDTTADFGDGIFINSVTYVNMRRVVVNITIDSSATVGGRTVTMTTGSDVIYEDDAFRVVEPPTPLPGLDTCSDADTYGAIPPGHYSGDTSSLNDDYDPTSSGCTGYSASGNDAAYRVDLNAGDTLRLSLLFEVKDASLYVVTDCSDVVHSCVAGADDTLRGEAETIEYEVPSSGAGTYYIIVDTYDTSGGEFELEIDY